MKYAFVFLMTVISIAAGVAFGIWAMIFTQDGMSIWSGPVIALTFAALTAGTCALGFFAWLVELHKPKRIKKARIASGRKRADWERVDD